eukprot:m.159128 g.159128  ORF g.159128 m.159128 type:complete len:314 (+) comp11743_c0_seq1:318-1259(+)
MESLAADFGDVSPLYDAGAHPDVNGFGAPSPPIDAAMAPVVFPGLDPDFAFSAFGSPMALDSPGVGPESPQLAPRDNAEIRASTPDLPSLDSLVPDVMDGIPEFDFSPLNVPPRADDEAGVASCRQPVLPDPASAALPDVQIKHEEEEEDVNTVPATPQARRSARGASKQHAAGKYTTRVGGTKAPSKRSRRRTQEVIRDELDRIIYDLFPKDVLRLEQKEFRAWQKKSGVRELTEEERKRLAKIRRMFLSRKYAESSRQRKMQESQATRNVLVALQAENQQLKDTVKAYEVEQARLQEMVRLLEAQRNAFEL